MSSANNATEGATIGGIADNNRRSDHHSSHLILKVEYILTNSNQNAHRRFRGNTLVEFEPNRANGFLGNQISEHNLGTDRRTERQTEGADDRDFRNYSMMSQNQHFQSTLLEGERGAQQKEYPLYSLDNVDNSV